MHKSNFSQMGNEDLGNHYYEMGDLIATSKAYSRMRDYCTTPNHITSMLFKLIAVSIERGDWLSVQSYVFRLRNIQSKPDEQLNNHSKMSAALALSQMQLSAYREAADTFLSVDPSLGNTFNEVLTANDVAVYGGLCALATMDRNELQQRVLNNASFRNFLELEPHIRRAISFFCNSKFRACFDILEAYRVDYLLDFYLRHHVIELYKRIRVKSMQQYLVPFNCVTLKAMAAIFSPSETGDGAKPFGLQSPLVQELIGLIESDILLFRIDLEHETLVSKQTNSRVQLQEDALESIRDFSDEAHCRILQAAVIKAGLQLPPAPGWRRSRMEDSMQVAETGAEEEQSQGAALLDNP